MRKLKFAIVGLGYIGRRHAAMVSENPETELVAAADINPEVSQYVNVPFYRSLEKMLDAVDCDVLIVATPNGMHAEQAMKGLQKGRHVLIEKPMALNTSDCNEILKQAEKADKKVFCVMQNRYSPPAAWLKGVLENNLLGRIYSVDVNCYWNRDDRYYQPGSWKGSIKQDGGVLFAQFSHFVDIMYWLFGEIENIQARFADFAHNQSTEFEDTGTLLFTFKNGGGLGTFHYTTAVWDRNFESNLTVIAENGTVKLGGQYMNEVKYAHIKNYKLPEIAPANAANDYGGYQGSAANHQFVIANVADCLLRGGRPHTTGLEGMKVVEMIENIYHFNDIPQQKARGKQGQ